MRRGCVGRSVGIVLGLVAPLAVGGIDAVGPPPPVAVAAAPLGFSDPVWWPLRDAARISCGFENCTVNGSPYHSNYAIDWVDADAGNGDPSPAHDPIHAAGSGIFHIGNHDPGCRSTGDEGRQGTWVWVDHGGGVATYYGHLDSIVVADGSWVTPRTLIATMGRSGAACNGATPTYYLHFEIRRGGFAGATKQRMPIPDLRACVGGQEKRYPDDLPGLQTTWDQFEISNYAIVPAAEESCIPATFATPARPTGVTGVIRPTSLVLSWQSNDVSVTETVVSIELWSPTVGAYGNPAFVYLSSAARTHEFTSLAVGRQYRLRVAVRNLQGSSRWPVALVMRPGSPTDPPLAPRYVHTHIGSITFGWYKPAHHGYPVTGYQVAFRRWTGTSWGSWQYARSPVEFLLIEGLRAGSQYQMKVRAACALGWSVWSASGYGTPG